jgi:acetyl esterase/lipase
MNKICVLLVLLTLLLPGFLYGQPGSDAAITKDIVYRKIDGKELKLDIGKPEGSGPFPVVLFFHGGGWQQGNKSHMHKWIRKFAERGYVGVTVAYRFAPEYRWPSQIEDAKEAVRFLRAHAAEYNIDPQRVGVMGESAGGYLALMLGVTNLKDSLEGESQFPEVSSAVQGVVSYFSATDFTTPRKELSPELKQEMLNYYKKPLDQVLRDFTGATSKDDPRLTRISVLPYVDENDAPVLIFQGDMDPFVSLEHAIKLKKKLEEAGVPHELVVVKGGGHGFTGEDQERTIQQMMIFLGAILQPTGR